MPSWSRGLRDAGGVQLPDALAQNGVTSTGWAAARVRLAGAVAYLELHIEQGPVLEARDLPLAVVTGTYGVERWAVKFTGQSAHAGSTPMDLRHDALSAPRGWPSRCASSPDARRGWNGRPDRRPAGDPDGRRGSRDGAGRPAPRRRRGARRRSRRRSAPARRSPPKRAFACLVAPVPGRAHPLRRGLVDVAGAIVTQLQGDDVRLPSGPLHDAARVADAGVPTVMLFVRTMRGLSHTREEDTDEADLELALLPLSGWRRASSRGAAQLWRVQIRS